MSKKLDTYSSYRMKLVDAHVLGHSDADIVNELRREIVRIRARTIAKSIELAGERTPYKAREVRRAATECIAVIERIIREIESKEIKV